MSVYHTLYIAGTLWYDKLGMLGQQLLFILEQAYRYNQFLVYLLCFLLFCFILSFFIRPLHNIRFLHTRRQVRLFRVNLLGLFLVVLGSLTYWGVDTYIVRLPHPVIPFIFFVLIYAIVFGFGNSFIVFIFSTWFVLEYLYRSNEFSAAHSVSVVLAVVALVAGLAIGLTINIYQKRLRRRIEELRYLVKLRDQFTSEAAHELKTPLTTIKLYAQMIEKDATKGRTQKKLRQKVSMIELEADKVTVLIDSLLDFSRLQSGKLQLSNEFFNFSDLVRERVSVMREIWHDHMFLLRKLPKNTIVFGDKIRLDQVLTNLLTNAAKYSPKQSSITVGLERSGTSYLLSVQDTGWGIPRAMQQHIFEPFYQLQRDEKSGFGGLGLGLYICAEILSLEKGSISVESKEGTGSIFTVRIPQPRRNNSRHKRPQVS